MRFSIIIVNYKSKNFLEKCLESIQKNSSLLNFEVIIVNNDEVFLNLKKKYQLNLKKIENYKNLGFAKACNLGAKKAKGEILLFLNPDTELWKSNFKNIYNEFNQAPEIGIIGINILDFNSQKTQPWINGKKTSLLRILFKKIIKKPWLSKKKIYLDWVSGGGLFVRKSLFEEVTGFDENFFMYFEDQDFCLRLKKQGFLCLFYPFFKILHHNGKSWENNFKQKKQIYYKSQEYFFKKHFPPLYFKIFKLFKKISRK